MTSRAHGSVDAVFAKRKLTVKWANRLLALTADESVHTPGDVKFVFIVLDIIVVGIETLRLKQSDLLANQRLTPVHKHEDRDIRRFPSTHKGGVCPENLNAGIAVVKSAQDGA
jgi:hypothetical protein